MTRKETITELKKYFNIKELVCRDVYSKFGDTAWQFIDTNLLSLLLILRTKVFNAPITINNWSAGGQFSQRGLRCNRCEIVRGKTSPYLSGHVLGKAIDCDVKGMTSAMARQKVKQNISLIPFNIRMEDGVNWLHIDVIDNGSKITLFKA